MGIFLTKNDSFCPLQALACSASLSPIAGLLAFVHVLNTILIFYLTKTLSHLHARHRPKHFVNINSVNSHNKY